MHKLAAKLKAGMVWGNCHSAIDHVRCRSAATSNRASAASSGRYGIEAYTELKTVAIAL